LRTSHRDFRVRKPHDVDQTHSHFVYKMATAPTNGALDTMAANARRAALAMGGLDAAARDAALVAVRAQLENSRALIEVGARPAPRRTPAPHSLPCCAGCQ